MEVMDSKIPCSFDVSRCWICAKMGGEFERFAKYNPHLVQYVHEWFSTSRLGFPKFVVRLSREMGYSKRYNYIYPVGGPIFIHVYRDLGYTHGIYHPIEPLLPPDKKILLRQVEELIASLIDDQIIEELKGNKAEVLTKLLNEVVEIVDKKEFSRITKNTRHLFSFRRNKKISKIYVDEETYARLKYEYLREKAGFGVLEPFLKDPYIEDISCDGVGPIFVEHKVFHSLRSTVEFKTDEELNAFIIRLTERIGKPVRPKRPIVDAALPDGSRLNVVFGRDISRKGSNFTIRKHSKIPLSITELIKFGTLDARIAAYLWMLLEFKMSLFICGETASGKTTTLNAITVFINPSAKIVSIEDTPEVVLPHPNWVSEVTRHGEDEKTSIDLYDLLKAALRQRPDYIIVGEIRGKEGHVAFQAMQSVAWETPVLIRDVITGKVELMPIGAFVDRFYKEYEEKIPKPVRGYEVLSMDHYGKVKWSRIEYVLRHRAEEVYEISYEGKGTIKATGSHSVFVLDEDTLEIRPKLVSELQRDDLLISFVRRNYVPSMSTIAETRKLPRKRSIHVELIDGGQEEVVTYTTRDKRLAVELIWLFKLAGLESKLSKAYDSRAGEYYDIHIRLYNTENSTSWCERVPLKPILKFLERTKLIDKLPTGLAYTIKKLYESGQRFITRRIARKILNFIEEHIIELNNENVLFINKLRKFLESDIALVRVLNVKKIPYRGYVYDLSTPETELFIGGEIPIALHNTGHPVLSTFHAANMEKLIQRLTGKPIEIPPAYIDNLNAVVFQNLIIDPRTGRAERRVISVNEVIGYDAAEGTYNFIEIFSWDPKRDVHTFRGVGNSYLLEYKIAPRRGYVGREVRKIYDELEMRAQIIQKLVENKVFNYYDVWKVISKIYEMPIEDALKRIDRICQEVLRKSSQ